MDYTYILNQINNLIRNDNNFLLVGLGVIFLILIFIISRTFRKSGLFLLAFTFLADFTIKKLPFNIYGFYPIVYKVVTGMYIAGFLNFLIRVIFMIKNANKKEKEDGKLKSFFKFTGIRPFFIMLVVNVLDFNSYIPENIKNVLTSLSFLYMAFKTLYSTYVFLTSKDKLVIDDKMNFDDIDAYLYDLENPKNKNRKRMKVEDIDSDDDMKIFTEEDKNLYTKPISISEINNDKKKEEIIKDIEEDLSNTDMMDMILDKQRSKSTTIRLTNLKSHDLSSYTSKKAKFMLVESDEYKVDLEFENINDYDYGRFIDLLIKYSKDKEAYKFELIVSADDRKDFKIMFFDPSEIFDIKNEKNQNIGGKLISMNFPKYKINFVKDNY